MPFELLRPIFRHTLTGLGFWLASKGYFDEAIIEGLVGGTIAFLSVGWFITETKLKERRERRKLEEEIEKDVPLGI